MDPQELITLDLGNGLQLRPFEERDTAVIFELVSANYEHLKKFMHWATPDYSLSDAEAFVSRSIADRSTGPNLNFGIFRYGELLGSIGFVYLDTVNRRTEIGYWIDKREEGKGIVSRSCKRLINYAFGDLQMNRVEIRCASENVRSSAIPERLGFQKEGLLRQSELREGRLRDFVIYGLLRSQWAGQSK